jgi:uncharacterized membrane protein
MGVAHEKPRPLDLRLAMVLSYGTWVATTLIVVGLALSMFGASLGVWVNKLSELGVIIIIVLPALRVTVMATAFSIQRDWVFAAIAGAVLGIIALSMFVGVLAG